MRNIQLRPINDIITEVREEGKRDAQLAMERTIQRTEETVRRIEQNRQAIALLDGAGIDLEVPEWSRGVSVYINLGFFTSTKKGNAALAEKVRLIRATLGCRIEKASQDLADGDKKHINIKMHPVDYPNIYISFQRRLPKSAKCKIVTQRSVYKTLVCTM